MCLLGLITPHPTFRKQMKVAWFLLPHSTRSTRVYRNLRFIDDQVSNWTHDRPWLQLDRVMFFRLGVHRMIEFYLPILFNHGLRPKSYEVNTQVVVTWHDHENKINDFSLDMFKQKFDYRDFQVYISSRSTNTLGDVKGFQQISNITVPYEGALQVITTRVILAGGWLASKNRIKIRDLSGWVPNRRPISDPLASALRHTAHEAVSKGFWWSIKVAVSDTPRSLFSLPELQRRIYHAPWMWGH